MRAVRDVGYELSDFIADLRAIAAETTDAARVIQRVRPLAQLLASDPTWLRPEHYEAGETQGFGVHLLHEEADHALAVFAISWLPGRGAPPHNHGTWAVVAGVDGPERNTFWKRVDDGTRQGYAEIVKAGERTFREGEVLCLMPDAIHSVTNDTERTTLSLHIYGKHFNYTGRSSFDPAAQSESPFIVVEG
jgi:predicted metal-dependent enzyme (double-stranded beta helix superfamily)